MYFQNRILIKIDIDYLTLISIMQKYWKNNIVNLVKVVLWIIKHFEFIKINKSFKMSG